MDYVIHALGLPFNGETLQTQSLGGSESAAYYLARELAARRHRVTVFTSHAQGGQWDGVTYVPAGAITQATPLGQQFEFYARNTPHDVLVMQRHPQAFAAPFASKVNLWQTHDYALHRLSPSVTGMMWNIDAVLAVSEWHRRQVCDVYALPQDAVRVVPNGVDAALYAGAVDESVPLPPTQKLLLLYQSRPERGLEHLLRPGGIMDRLRDVAHLVICGYDNTTAEMAPYYAQLAAWAAGLPNVTHVGALTKAQLAGVQRRCDLLVYPTEFEETSCITAMEAMHAGLPLLTSAAAALPETCAGSGTLLLPLKDGVADEAAFVAEIERLAADEDALAALRAAQLEAATTRTWSAACDAFEAVVDDCFARKSPTAVARHLMKVSDVATFDHLDLPANAICDRLRQEREQLFGFLADDESYAVHYQKHCGTYYDEHPKEVLRRIPEDTTRYKGVVMHLARVRERLGRPLRVLDYGCAHGHYTLGLARAFPDCEFTGIDISRRAVEEATAWAAEAGVPNATFGRLRDGWHAQATYDVVLLAEVLEHVRDYRALLEQARTALDPDGALITTTPYGPWEWTGHEPYKQAREHWQQFERQDLVEIFADMRPEIACAPAGHTASGTALGSWVCLAWPGEHAFGRVDVARKLAQTRPEQTVSACLIVKDGANTLRKALDSLVPWVHEVVIGIDQATTDATLDVITAFERANPWLPVRTYQGPRAIDSGFDVARNLGTEQACGDWILWMDADEELVGGDQLTKLLRTNMHQAYACPQIHFSVQPPQVLTTDFPSRLFRHNGAVRFYGRVHEHPETTPGEAIPTATPRHELQFAHNGYITEEKRRERYFRNLPLLMRDIDEHPDRLLNKFLLIRDLAQGIGFELQQSGGRPLPDHPARAQRVIDLWRELLGNEKPVSRMLLDAMQYYTMAAEVLGGAFDVNVSLATAKAPHQTNLNVQGKFLRPDDLSQLLTRLSKEATANYDSRYF